MKNVLRMIGIIALAIIIGLGTAYGEPSNPLTPTTPEPMSSKTAMQYFKDEGITIGINIGNSLDAVDNWTTPGKPIAIETAWYNVKLNQAHFNGLAAQGYKIVRIPVTWTGHIGNAPNYTVSEERLYRVAEVVGYAKTAGLKSIINIHHDGNLYQKGMGAWLLIGNAASDPSITDKFVKVWTQIAEYFKNYGDYLMFQGFNEIHAGGNYGSGEGTAAQYKIINDWNQKFTNAVRGTGGNNVARYLLYYGYNTHYTISNASSPFKIPTDTATNRQIVGFHFYEPWDFAGAVTTHNWGTAKEKAKIDNVFNAFKKKFINNNIPVIIGECGPARYVKYSGGSGNSGYDAANVSIAQQNRLLYIDYFYGKARENGIVPFFWENGAYPPANQAAEGDFSLFNRNNGQPNSTESRTVIERMINAVKN